MAYGFLQATTSDANATSYTFAAQNLGAADATRIIIVAAMVDAAATFTIGSITVGGVTATIDQQISSIRTIALARATVPAGTSGDVVVTSADATAGTRAAIALWRVTGVTLAVADADQSTANPGSITLTPGGAGDYLIAASRGNATSGCTWTTAAEDFDTIVEATRTWSGASMTTASGANVTVTATIGTNTSTVAAAYTPTDVGGGPVDHPLSGSVAAITVAAGAISATLALAGTIAGVSTTAGAPTALHPLGGAVAAVSTVAGAPIASHPLAATVAATSTVTGTPTARHPLSGSTAAVSSASGSVTATSGSNDHPVAGTVAASSSTAGTVTLVGALSGTTHATTAAAGTPAADHPLGGTVAATTTATGAPSSRQAVTGTAAATSSVSGTITASNDVPIVGERYAPGPPARTYAPAATLRTYAPANPARTHQHRRTP